MTQDDIIEMARQAELVKIIDCCGVVNKFCSQDQWKGNLSVFAKLVAAKEREECIKVCENIEEYDKYIDTYYTQSYIDAIRKRGEA